MDIEMLFADAEDQERGAWLELADAVTGKPTGMRFLIVGPDSRTQRAAKIAMMDELVAAANPDGTVSAEALETARLNCLARCVRDFEVTSQGARLPYSHAMMVRILRTSAYVEKEIDDFAGNRAHYRSKPTP